MLRSSFSIRRVIPCEKGVSTTHGISGNSPLMARATVKASLSALPGIQMTKSTLVVARIFSASAIVETCVKVGG